MFSIIAPYKKLFAHLVVLALIVIGVAAYRPAPAHAVFGVGDTTVLIGDVSPTGIANNISIWAGHLKDFVLDKLAYIAAKQILHQMTVSVINWINSGYKGKPAFLTDPSAFFLDAADQATGAFLAENGPLRRLCSPWSVDIRVALALGQLNNGYNGISSQRYTCTFGTIGRNFQGVNGNVNVNAFGNDINAFVHGDFSQGGWDSFISLTTENQNNPWGSYLMAQADQQYLVGQRKSAISADLSQSGGFLSWEECTDLPAESYTADDVDNAESGSVPGRKVSDKGLLQECSTKTPGKVVADSLHDQLQSPVMELELANDINAIISAAVSQLVTQTLQKGLYALGGNGQTAGSGRAYLQQVYSEATTPKTVSAAATIDPTTQSLTQARDQYAAALKALSQVRGAYIAAHQCFVGKAAYMGSTPGATNNISYQTGLISTAVSGVDALINQLAATKATLDSELSRMNGPSNPTVPGTNNIDTLSRSIEQQTNQYLSSFSTFSSSNTDVQGILARANGDYAQAMEKVKTFTSDAASFQAACDKL